MKHYIKYYFCCLITLSFLFVGWGRAEAGVVAPTCTIQGAEAGTFECGSTLNLSAKIVNNGFNEFDFNWSSDCGTFDNANSATPTLTVFNPGVCPLTCSIDLTVSGNPSGFTCSVENITVQDTTDPQITCPADVTIECGQPSDPSNTGGDATATDCDDNVVITLVDVVTGNCPPEQTITRTFTATDVCGNTSECTQIITLVPVRIDLDIKPQSCPNPLNVKSQGLLPVAILGNDLDVEQIDVATLFLDGVAPARSVIEDVATPSGTEPCDCLALSGDGTDDLVLKFKIQDILATCGEVDNGDVIPLTLTGELLDGTAFEGIDCILIRGVK